MTQNNRVSFTLQEMAVRTAQSILNELGKRFNARQFARLEVALWLFLAAVPIFFSGGSEIIREYGPNELFRPRFYVYLWSSGSRSWLLGVGVLLFVFLFRYLFSALPLSLIREALSSVNSVPADSKPSESRKSDVMAESSEESVNKTGVNATEAAPTGQVENKPQGTPEIRPEELPSAFAYLRVITARSQKVADDSVRRANVHLIGGVLIGALGMIFFFVSTASDEWTKNFAKATDTTAAASNAAREGTPKDNPAATSDKASESKPKDSAGAPASGAASEGKPKEPATNRTSPSSPGSQVAHEVPVVPLSPTTLILLNLAHSLPRITILIFIEVLAGFFLKQYRTAMEEFRYYEALARRRESVVASYLLRKECGDNNALSNLSSEIIDQPLATLKEGETTMVIKSQELSDNDNLKIIEQMFGFLTKLKEEAKPKIEVAVPK